MRVIGWKKIIINFFTNQLYLFQNSSFQGYDTKLHLVVKSNSWDLKSLEYHFIVITFKSTLTRRVNTC